MFKHLAKAAIGLSLFAVSPTVFADTTTQTNASSSFDMMQKQIQVNASTISSPSAFVHSGTTYMPIWYLIQALAKLGITSNWSGTEWSITTPASMKPDLSQLSVGTGQNSIVINGTLVKQVNGISVTDPASNQTTTYMPIWYLTNILGDLGVKATWNGSALSVFTPTYANQLSQVIIDSAKKYLGTPYQWGGESSSGIDCSGLVQTAFRSAHITLPRVAAEQAQVGTVVPKNDLAPGDLVFFDTLGNPFSHVGIYIGNNRFISATTSRGVTISSLNNPFYWGPRFTRATAPVAAL